MTPKHKCLRTFASGLVGPYGVGARSSGCPKKPLRTCASWTEPTSAGSNAGNGTWRWLTLRRLRRLYKFPSRSFSGESEAARLPEGKDCFQGLTAEFFVTRGIRKRSARLPHSASQQICLYRYRSRIKTLSNIFRSDHVHNALNYSVVQVGLEAQVARPKQHHFVTRAYLEGFLKSQTQHLVCYGRNNRGPFRRSPSDLACRRNYYALKKEDGTWDDSIEKLIDSTVESPGLPVIQKLALGRTRITWQDRDSLALFIAFQELRTPFARERARAFSKMLNDRVFHEITTADPHQNSVQLKGESGTSTVTLNQMKRGHETLCDDHSMEIHRSLMGGAFKLFEFYRYMKFTVFYATGKEKFLTTDSPVIRVFQDGAPLGTGINRPDVEIRFPLSRNAFLTLTHDVSLRNALERANKKRKSRLLQLLPEIRIVDAVDSQVTMFNRGHARHAHQWLFASAEVVWAAGVLSEAAATPQLLDLSSHDLIHFQSSVNYDPKMDSRDKK
jgi:hypothetical protein